MRRRLVLILSVLSLPIGVLLMAAWVRGQWRADWLRWQQTDPEANTWRCVHVVGGTSGIYVSRQRFDFRAAGAAPAYAQEYNRDLGRVSGLSHFTTDPQGNAFARGNSFANGSSFNRVGFGYRLSGVIHDTGSSGAYSYRYDRAQVPYWALTAGFLGAGLPSVRAFLARRRRGRRVAAECCPSCGYNLRATPDRCPECGAVPRGLQCRKLDLSRFSYAGRRPTPAAAALTRRPRESGPPPTGSPGNKAASGGSSREQSPSFSAGENRRPD